MMNEQIVQMGLMWVLAGLSAGWLAETCISRRGYGLLVDMGLGVGAGLAGGGVFLAISGLPAGMLVMFVCAFSLAAGVILAQRLGWPCEAGERERKARLRLSELGRPSLGEKRTSSPGLLRGGNGRTGPPTVTRTLMRIATTGIYLLRGVPLELQRAARVRAVSDGTTLRQVLLKGLGEYAAGTWTPRTDDTPPVALTVGVQATRR
jgi:uncharacterized membrane protein YeaQ/YmgE (transglycosylase-associated protein family)